VDKLTSDSPSHSAVLGGGGIGKTSVALAVIDHPAIRSRNRCSFLPCDSILSSMALLLCILQVLGDGAGPGPTGDPFARLASRLDAIAPLVLVLDNFESPWDAGGTRTELTHTLRVLASSPKLQLIITMRGDCPPADGDVQWAPVFLQPLSASEARDLFLAMNPRTRQDEHDHLSLLLKELDGLPLAVKLIAQLKGSSTCASLLRRWENKKTSLIKTENKSPSRLTSLDVSISLSLNSDAMSASPEALSLLRLLCHLPDGVKDGDEQLVRMKLGFEDVDSALAAILAAVLAMKDPSGAIRVLSPIRQYMMCHYPLPTPQLQALNNYYIQLVQTHAAQNPKTAGFLEACEVLFPEMGNIIYVFCCNLKDPSTTMPGVVDAAFLFAHFQTWTRYSTEIMDELLRHWTEYGIVTPRSTCLVLRSRIHGSTGRYSAALEDLKLAVEETDDLACAAECFRLIADIHGAQGEYDKAVEKLKLATVAFSTAGDRSGELRCLKTLGEAYRMQGAYSLAAETLKCAYAGYLEIGDKHGAMQCLQCSGDILYMLGRFDEALEAIQQVHDGFVTLGDCLGALQCMRTWGNIYSALGDETQAAEKLHKAHTGLLEAGNALGALSCLRSLGEFHRTRKEYTKAFETLQSAVDMASTLGARYELGHCHLSLGLLYQDQCLYVKALHHVEVAISIFTEINSENDIALCSKFCDVIKAEMTATESHSSRSRDGASSQEAPRSDSE
jgi:tetratricopeptide (TPR) repeat protein